MKLTTETKKRKKPYDAYGRLDAALKKSGFDMDELEKKYSTPVPIGPATQALLDKEKNDKLVKESEKSMSPVDKLEESLNKKWLVFKESKTKNNNKHMQHLRKLHMLEQAALARGLTEDSEFIQRLRNAAGGAKSAAGKVLSGAGIAYDAYDAYNAGKRGDWAQVGVDAASAGLLATPHPIAKAAGVAIPVAYGLYKGFNEPVTEETVEEGWIDDITAAGAKGIKNLWNKLKPSKKKVEPPKQSELVEPPTTAVPRDTPVIIPTRPNKPQPMPTKQDTFPGVPTKTDHVVNTVAKNVKNPAAAVAGVGTAALLGHLASDQPKLDPDAAAMKPGDAYNYKTGEPINHDRPLNPVDKAGQEAAAAAVTPDPTLAPTPAPKPAPVVTPKPKPEVKPPAPEVKPPEVKPPEVKPPEVKPPEVKPVTPPTNDTLLFNPDGTPWTPDGKPPRETYTDTPKQPTTTPKSSSSFSNWVDNLPGYHSGIGKQKEFGDDGKWRNVDKNNNIDRSSEIPPEEIKAMQQQRRDQSSNPVSRFFDKVTNTNNWEKKARAYDPDHPFGDLQPSVSYNYNPRESKQSKKNSVIEAQTKEDIIIIKKKNLDSVPTLAPVIKTFSNMSNNPFQVRGDETTGFTITLRDKTLPTQFASLDEATMAVEMFCNRQQATANTVNNDYIDER